MLFEYGHWQQVQDPKGLKQLLVKIWQDQYQADQENELHDSRYQPFLSFDENKVRANNYIGFIQYADELIEIYPKVFREQAVRNKALMLEHVFYWFSYCRKWRFPFSQSNLDRRDIDSFPELIIYLISRQFLDTVSGRPFMQYHPVSETLDTLKGGLNFGRYISRGLSNGRQHQLECDHSPFVFDNKINRVIKYCSRFLLDTAKSSESQQALRDVLFVLDEVEDQPVTAQDASAASFNLFYDDYRLVMDMCKSVLNHQLYSHQAYDTSQWCLLFPMEYIFEDFVAGFLETHFSDRWDVRYQKSEMSLSSNPDAFQMQHDIFMTEKGGGRKIIIDTKYKLRQYSSEDKKLGVVQADLYQLVSYAFRRGCKECILIYPNVNEEIRHVRDFTIPSGFGNDVITVKVVEIPFWSLSNFQSLDNKLKLEFQKLF